RGWCSCPISLVCVAVGLPVGEDFLLNLRGPGVREIRRHGAVAGGESVGDQTVVDDFGRVVTELLVTVEIDRQDVLRLVGEMHLTVLGVGAAGEGPDDL